MVVLTPLIKQDKRRKENWSSTRKKAKRRQFRVLPRVIYALHICGVSMC
jgi:hypothetical protein